MNGKAVRFHCGDITLEGVLHMPQQSHALIGAVVVCHPHPLYGGDMDNNVVMAVCGGLEHAGIAALRFNFRGVGGSEGSFANGIGEQDDVAAAISFLSADQSTGPKAIGLCGYSFGAGVAFQCASKDKRVRAFACISILASSVDAGACYAGHKLLITGSRDLLTPAHEAESLADKLCEPKQFRIISGADHFWLGHEEEMVNIVVAFFVKALHDQRPLQKQASA